MAALGSLVVSLSANTAEFTAGMDKAAYQTEKAMKQMKKDAEMVGAAIGAMAVAGVGALVVMVKASLDAMDTMSKLAQQTGTAVESLSALSYTAGMSGVNQEKLGGALVKLTKNMSDAADGTGEAKKGFDALGISVANADGTLKSSDAVLSEVAGKFAGFKDGAEKTALAVNLFGKSGAELIPMLNSGADGLQDMADEARRMGLVLDTETSRAAEVFNDTMSKLSLQQTAFANAVTTAVLPVLQSIADEMLGAGDNTDKFKVAAEGIKVTLQTLVVLGSEVAFTFGRVGNTLGGMAAQVSALGISFSDIAGGPAAMVVGLGKAALSGEISLSRFSAINDMIIADDAKALADHNAFIAKIMNPQAAASGFVGPLQPKGAAPRIAGTPTAGAKGKDPDAGFEAYMKKLESQISKVQELTAVEKLLKDIRSGSLTVNAGQEATLKGIANDIDATKEAIRISSERVALRRKDEQDSLNAIRQIEADTARANQQNAANVENIRIGLMSELGQETLAHELRLGELQKFHDLKLENVTQANALIEAENARHEQTKLDLQAAHDLQALSMAGNSADQLYGLMLKAGMDQSALGKAVFLASKAMAIAEIIINTEVAAAKATAMFPVFGSALAMGIRVAGYASAGLVGGLAIAEASAEGGYDIPAGTNPMTQLHEREMVLPKAQADVIRGLASNGGAGGEMKLTIVNNTSAPIGQVTEQRISANERALIIQEAVGATAAQFGDPNSQTSRAMSRNYATQRSR
ncbi:hypothetical protein [Polaromonas sp. CG_23.6]|uniref:hypothetical protein n=1 Tax=Polaromonas sp. CG_23.6 TaxID=2760709 RepID=UPI002472ED48|nr:hypothetical protein [Polaromonas sp. CG_23.6]MDH6185478.1 hypothetical protein [Polaromonas sp. CG_23.6]